VGPELKFQAQAPAPSSEGFWFRLQTYLIHCKLKTIVLFAQLAFPTN